MPGGLLTADEIANLLVTHGFKTREGSIVGTAVVLAESGGRIRARNSAGNSPPSVDRGIWQINSHWHKEVSDACAYNPACATRQAARISGGGSNFSQWSAFKNGSYKRHLALATRAVERVAGGGFEEGLASGFGAIPFVGNPQVEGGFAPFENGGLGLFTRILYGGLGGSLLLLGIVLMYKRERPTVVIGRLAGQVRSAIPSRGS
jgi:hypothetical protein